MFVYINLSLSLKRLRAAHEITNNIEEEIKSRILCVERVIIHYEPSIREAQFPLQIGKARYLSILAVIPLLHYGIKKL